MPSAYSIFEKFEKASLPTKTVLIRLLGSDRHGIEKKTRKHWTGIVDPMDKTIQEISEFVKKPTQQKCEVYAKVNNHPRALAKL